jgi:hypothetical protein
MGPEVLEAGNAAMGLWVRAGAWSAANMTDGFIPTRAAALLGTRNLCNKLVKAGLFDETTGGYRFRDWREKFPTKPSRPKLASRRIGEDTPRP